MSDYNKFTAMLASEFHRYLMEDEEKANVLPENVLLIFQVEGEEDFNRWHKEMSLRNMEAGQSVAAPRKTLNFKAPMISSMVKIG